MLEIVLLNSKTTQISASKQLILSIWWMILGKSSFPCYTGKKKKQLNVYILVNITKMSKESWPNVLTQFASRDGERQAWHGFLYSELV